MAAAWCVERLLGDRPGARPAALWFATATAVSLVTGRLTFALGLALACAAILGLARGRIALAALPALLTPLASPVAGAFLALVVVAWALAGEGRARWPVAALLCVLGLAPVAVLGVVFPEGGDFPFAADAFFPTLAASLLVLALLPREQRALRIGVALYALVLVASYVLETPMGGNAVRLGAVLAGPVVAYALWPARRTLLLLLAPVLLYWQWAAPVDDWVRASSDASVRASYYEGLNRFLASRPGPLRLEIPFTDNHWESAHVAKHVPLARGWERQLDREVNALFYDDAPLTDARYRRWLDEAGVSYVALADAPLDYSAAEEAALIRRGPAYLREVWRDAHWRVYEVRGARGLASGGRVTRLDADLVELEGAGRVRVRVRWTPYWRLATGTGCVRPDGDWTVVELARPGRARLVTDFALGRVGSRDPRCVRTR